MEHCVFFAFLIIISCLFANIEIQIEGKYGWAEKLPTWRIENNWTKILYNKRPLTGYHLYMQTFLLLIIHLPFALNIVLWKAKYEVRIISFIILFWILEDFLWFICNKEYGLSKFRPEHIWWHRGNWWWIMPKEYWIWTPIGVSLYILSY